MVCFPELENVKLVLTLSEPAQQQASNSFLTAKLIEVISSPNFNDSRAFLGYTCKLLDLMIAQCTCTQPYLMFITNIVTASDPELAPDNTAIVLLKIAADRELPTDMELWLTYNTKSSKRLSLHKVPSIQL
jgi:hypothetical protein